jgi:ribonuclease P protein component
MVARLLRSADFQRVLAASPRSRSAHFAVHHVPACPSLPAGNVRKAAKIGATSELSTGDAPTCPPAVDESVVQPLAKRADVTAVATLAGPPTDRWLGLVVPKRHAKRSVTRNLIKRQMRAVMAALADTLPPGLWVLRLKAPFDRKQFTSPASDALRLTAHDELALLLQRAAVPR